jgi:hypothetical protein
VDTSTAPYLAVKRHRVANWAICQPGGQAIDADRDGAPLDPGDVGDARRKGPPRRAAKPPDVRQDRRTLASAAGPPVRGFP